MIVLGLILIIVGYLLTIPALYTIGFILLAVGLLLLVLGGIGRPVAGRRWYY